MTHDHTVIMLTDVNRHRAALCAWAEANGIEPKTVTLDPITIRPHGDGLVIEYRAYLLDEEGHQQLDPDQRDEVLTVRRSARLVSPLSAHGLDADQLSA